MRSFPANLFINRFRTRFLKKNIEVKLLLLLIFIKLNWLFLNLNCLNCFQNNLIVYKTFHYKISNQYVFLIIIYIYKLFVILGNFSKNIFK